MEFVTTSASEASFRSGHKYGGSHVKPLVPLLQKRVGIRESEQEGPGEASAVWEPNTLFAWLSLAWVPGQNKILTQNPKVQHTLLLGNFGRLKKKKVQMQTPV